MSFRVAVGPPQIAIHQGQTVLVTENTGNINWPSEKGLYLLDTRIISSWAVYANGSEWELLNSGPVSYYAARIFLANPDIMTEIGKIPAHTLGLEISRGVAGGVHEDLDITNHGQKPVKFNLEIALRCDFADVFEVKSGNIVRRGRITTEWRAEHRDWRTIYRNRDFERGLTITASRDDGVSANGRLTFDVALAPGEKWHCCLLYNLHDGSTRHDAPSDCVVRHSASEHAESLAAWQQATLKILSANEEFYRLYRQAIEDMAALRLPIPGSDHVSFMPAAGLPWFIAPFGRDSLIVSLQNMIVHPDFARSSLEFLGRWQARDDDPYRDAEPGKILHELRFGELAHFKEIPHTPYYGTADATILWLITLHAAWRSTGDKGLLEQHLETAELCLEWIDKYGDRDGDGFQEYQTRSKSGYENMGWKDSGEAVMYPDGSLVRGPKALCELQGYVYDAWQRMAEAFDALGKPDRARALRDKAAALFKHFNEAFWDEESGYYAYALDGDKKQVLTVASNPGHCLWSGIVPRDRAARVVQRLFQPDMWSGWGIRTLSAKNPAFNPYAYQLGAVWPHDNGIIALGLKRYGFRAEVGRVARDISEAGSRFQVNQLPELYAGTSRSAAIDFPVQYLGANVPQAWAAGSVFMMLQAMLGIVPDAPRKRLYLDPALPEWLPSLTLIDLRLGEACFDIRFWREDGDTHFETLRGDRGMVEARSANFGPSFPKT